MIRMLYTLLGILITPALSLWLFKRAARGKEELLRLRERFGYSEIARPQGTILWLHAASVGEAQSVLTLVRAILARGASLHILVTTGTVTSAAMIAKANLPRVIHQYIPLDTYFSVQRFLRHWQPDIALWVESEFWPQLLWSVRARQVPLLLINARMSARSFHGWKRWPSLAQSLLACFDTIYAGSAEDAERLRVLGAATVIEAGNLKFDAAPLMVDDVLRQQLEPICAERTTWLAASTHANEEQMIGEVHKSLQHNFSNLLTILVPRHATRGDAIAADLRARGLTLAQRSKKEAITADTQIYLADTMGELGTFYGFCDLVFLGGSLIAHGGQNPLEPARLNCALITGPHTHNFTSIMRTLESAGGLRRVEDTHSLIEVLRELLRNAHARQLLAKHALEVVSQARGATEAILQTVFARLEAR